MGTALNGRRVVLATPDFYVASALMVSRRSAANASRVRPSTGECYCKYVTNFSVKSMIARDARLKFNTCWWLQMLVVYIPTTVFLLHKSTKPVVSAAQIGNIWDRVDHSRSGHLDSKGFTAVLLHIGNRNARSTPAKEIPDRLLLFIGVSISDEKVQKLCIEFGVDKHGRIARADFVRIQAKAAPSQVNESDCTHYCDEFETETPRCDRQLPRQCFSSSRSA
jgi:hypothetical protein